VHLTAKLIASHRVDGDEVAIRIDQTLTQDATGTLVMLELEAMGLDRVKTELSAQYVDHNLLQTDFRNPDDHLFLRSACRKFGVRYSPPGNGVSHPVHMERFGVPGKTLLGSDSHTPAAGALGMLAIGAGGLDVALAMAGEPFRMRKPRVMGVELTGELPPWVSAKDVILEMLRRHGVDGAIGAIVEYHGEGLACLSAMDRHVVANMGTELGATTTVFPSDEEVRRFLAGMGREEDWVELSADEDARYDEHERIDLSALEPLVACPSSPGNVVPVAEVAGREIYQAMIGSSANPGYRDFAVPALMVEGRTVHDRVSFDVNPTSRRTLELLVRDSHVARLLRAGARLHQAGCNGCIGMGQAPATGRISLRTVPRNFPGRSGTREDQVYLCSPETATASALAGVITDPRTLDMEPPVPRGPKGEAAHGLIVEPAPSGADVEIERGPNIAPLPELDPLPEALEGPVLLHVGDDVSTDEILPAGSQVLPYRSSIPEISRFAFSQIDEEYYERAKEHRESGSFVVGGRNYGQGSSREHAALVPRYLGVRAVLAKGFARIHGRNLASHGVLPLVFVDEADHGRIEQGDELRVGDVRRRLEEAEELEVENRTRGETYRLRHELSRGQVESVLEGGVLNLVRKRSTAPEGRR